MPLPCRVPDLSGALARRGRSAACVMVLLAAASCAGVVPGETGQPPADATPFVKALHQDYLDLARSEQDQYDWRDATFYAERARQTAANAPPEPQPAEARDLDAENREQMRAVRETVVDLLARGRDKAPGPVARVQTAYECWLEQLEEGHQSGDIQECAEQFAKARELAEEALRPPPPPDVVIVLPEDDGSIGGVVVQSGDRQVLLNQALAAARVFEGRGIVSGSAADTEVRSVFGRALEAQPRPPVRFTLYFENDSTELTPDSVPVLQQILAEIAARQHPEITLAGHADRTGRTAYNEKLSRKRVQATRESLIEGGARADLIEAAAFGEAQPQVPTADGVAEPRNRRVEVLVR